MPNSSNQFNIENFFLRAAFYGLVGKALSYKGMKVAKVAFGIATAERLFGKILEKEQAVYGEQR